MKGRRGDGSTERLARALQAGDRSAARRALAGLTGLTSARPDDPGGPGATEPGGGRDRDPGGGRDDRDRRDRDAVLDVLAGAAAGGSLLAVELLAEKVDELGLARRAVRRLLVDESAVDDVAQDVLVAMAASVRSFRGDARFTTWLYQIARHRVVDHLRRQRAVEPLDEHDVGDARRISSMIASREAARRLVERLPDRYREAVVLRDVERLGYPEVAERLGLNVNTVKSHVARGRAVLARLIEARGAR